MKLLRYGPPGGEKPGVLDANGAIRSLEGLIDDLTPEVIEKDLDRIRAAPEQDLPLVEGEPRLGAPIASVGKILCVGLNYARHARESGMKVPDEPVIFMKAVTAITGPNDPVVLPPNASKTDWEVEHAVIIGKAARYVDEETAMDHVAGYSVLNDVSERAFQLEMAGQWVKGKSCDTFAPLGPWLVTKDEIADPHKLPLWLEVNGHRYQDSSTSDNIFSIQYIVSYLSRFMTLLPGDVIATGTPEGTGMGQRPPVYLKAGDVMRVGVEGLGEQRQEVVAFRHPDEGIR